VKVHQYWPCAIIQSRCPNIQIQAVFRHTGPRWLSCEGLWRHGSESSAFFGDIPRCRPPGRLEAVFGSIGTVGYVFECMYAIVNEARDGAMVGLDNGRHGWRGTGDQQEGKCYKDLHVCSGRINHSTGRHFVL